MGRRISLSTAHGNGRCDGTGPESGLFRARVEKGVSECGAAVSETVRPGWFLCGAPGNDLSPLNYWKQHVQYFQGPNKLMYLSSGAEGDESVYITSEDGFYKLCGYSIYYERNQMMQDYMVLRKDVKRIESGSDEKVIQEFRKRMDEHKDEVTDRHQTLGLLRGMCMAMSIVILAGGIVMFNNYERMQEMESVIASAIPERVESA